MLDKILQGIFYEKTPENSVKFSLGRLLLVCLFVAAMIMWSTGRDIPSTMLTVLLTFIGYNFGTKAVTAFEKLVIKK
jgi:hypothetical protein